MEKPLTVFLLTLLCFSCVELTKDQVNFCDHCSCGVIEIPLNDETNYKVKQRFVHENQVNISGSHVLLNCRNETNMGGISGLSWPNLRNVNVYANFRNNRWQKLSNIPDSIKSGMVKLDLADNLIETLTKEDMLAFKNLENLRISKNQIAEIDEQAFRSLNNLKKLDLSHNVITNLSDYSFSQTSLVYLNLSGNYLSYLSSKVFEGLVNLTVLDLSHNRLAKLPKNFHEQVRWLVHLNLMDNKFENLPEFPDGLEILSVDNNGLAGVNLKLAKLRIFRVCRNNLKEFQLVSDNLQILLASHNNISSIEKLDHSMLKILDLSFNEFLNIPDVINSDSLPSMQELYFEGNPISRIQFPLRAAPFKSLHHISLSHSMYLKKIEHDAFNNVFPEYSPSSSNKYKEVSINVSHCKIEELEWNIFQDIVITSVDLSHNLLMTLPRESMKWKNMTYVNLQHNPWRCDCENQWILDELVPYLYSSHPALLMDMRCASPNHFAGKPFAYWYNHNGQVFCEGPSVYYFTSPTGEVLEIWTAQMLVCIVLGVIIAILLIAILFVVFYPRNKNRKPKRKRKSNNSKPILRNSRSANPQYKEIRMTIEDLRSSKLEHEGKYG